MSAVISATVGAMRRPRKRWLVGLAAAIAALGLGTELTLRTVTGEPKFDVVSIAKSASYQDRALLERAWRLPAAQAMHAGFVYQENGSICGPTSLADVEHSLGKAATARGLLDGTWLCPLGICLGGITLDQLAKLAHDKAGHRVTVLRDLSPAQFREQMRRSNDALVRYTANFHRGPLFGAGGGHHSPIGGYLEDLDLVFVLDVNQKFKPWLVPSERLHAAIDTVDSVAGRKRGLLLIE
jgi:hypothetical protein